MTNDLFGLKEQLDQRNIFFCFKGPVSQGLVVEMGGLLQQKMSRENVKKMAMMRMFSVMVENAQNILRYSSERIVQDSLSSPDEELSVGIIAVGQERGAFFVLSGNIIDNEQVAPLRDRLERIRSMTPDELKHYYLEQRRRDLEPGSRGAGLGFIDMARKSSQPLEYEFTPIDAYRSFFSIKIMI